MASDLQLKIGLRIFRVESAADAHVHGPLSQSPRSSNTQYQLIRAFTNENICSGLQLRVYSQSFNVKPIIHMPSPALEHDVYLLAQSQVQ